MFEIRQTAPDVFEVLRSGVVIATCATQAAAVAALATAAAAEQLAAADTAVEGAEPPAAHPGRLPERWTSGPAGICLNADTGDGRDFTDCVWTWRDPSVSLVPLMLQTTTDFGHFGAVLAGWAEEFSTMDAGGVASAGWFYDSDAGRQFRDMLLASERFGVSVDPGAVEVEEVCLEWDEDDWGAYCVDGRLVFHAYEIIGITGTPFPGFATAAIRLDTAAGGMAASAGLLDYVAPADAAVSRDVFTMAEPDDGDARYVDQGPIDEARPELGRRWGIPFTLNADGSFYGHVAIWGTCHVGFPDQCVTPPPSPSGYAEFHLGRNPYGFEDLPTGVFVIGCDHAPRLASAAGARDHYANTGMGWGDARLSDGRHGIWACGQVRSHVGPEVRALLNASSLSGDWREFGQALDMVAVQSVNVPGFPIRRQASVLAAAADPLPELAGPVTRFARGAEGRTVELVGAGMVRRSRAQVEALVAAGTVECLPCAARASAGRGARAGRSGAAASTFAQRPDTALHAKIDELTALVARLERRTRHLIPAEAQALAAGIAAHSA